MRTVLAGSVAGNAMPLLYQCRGKPVDIAQGLVNRLAASGHINWLVRDAVGVRLPLVRREVWSADSSPTHERVPVHASPAVHAGAAPQVAVRTDRLTKRFGDVVAVDELSLTVSRARCSGSSGRTVRGNPPQFVSCWV